MNRYFIYVIATLMLLSPLTLFAESPAPGLRPVEIRAVWMDRKSIPKTEEGIRDLIRQYADAGINVVHPEVIYYGYSAYPSAYLKQNDLWNGIDMLGILLSEAHKRGIEVHPWVWVFRTGNTADMGGILKDHPEWMALGKNGKGLSNNGGYWLCPSIPEVRTLLLNAIVELAQKYPIDGVQLDYVRFEEQYPVSYCYNDNCRNAFKAQYLLDPVDIRPFTKGVLDWQLWREDLINTFVAQVSDMLKKVRPEIKVSAAVGSIPDRARVNLMQNWPHWAENRWVDYLSPMDYTANTADFIRRQNASTEAIGTKTLLAPGVGLYTMKGEEPMLEQVSITNIKPVDGVTLFATAYLDGNRIKALEDGPFKGKASLPFRNPVEGARAFIAQAESRITQGTTPEELKLAVQSLDSAKRLLEYARHTSAAGEYVPPAPPPIFIPETILPLPQADAVSITGAPKIDGRLDDPAWQKAKKIAIQYTNLGFDTPHPTDIYLMHSKDTLYMGFRCRESKLNMLKFNATEHDGPVFNDDSIELFISTQSTDAGAAAYFHFALNVLGTKYERKSSGAWNGKWECATGREPGAWIAEAAIPFSSLGIKTLAPGTTWRVNFCRNRTVSGVMENLTWSPTYGPYHTPSRFGLLTLR